MAKHTPGPWEVVKNSRGGITNVKAGDFDILLATRHGCEASIWDANAYLISATPDLLEACQFALSVLRSHPNTGNSTDFNELRETLQDAIKKAEGAQ